MSVLFNHGYYLPDADLLVLIHQMQTAIKIIRLNHALASGVKKILCAAIRCQVTEVTGVLSYFYAPLPGGGSCGGSQNKVEVIAAVRSINVH